MTTKTKLLIAAASLLTAFAFGRWSAPEYQKTTKDQSETTDSSSHKKTTVVEKEKPDGTKEKKTIVEEDRDRSKSKTSSETEETLARRDRVSLSALGGFHFNGESSPDYGISISKPVLGPITLGIWGLQSGVIGASIGLTF